MDAPGGKTFPFRPRPGLFLVATPIGNLRDITLRALDVLSACDVLCCEDTRRARKLLAAHGLSVSGKRFIVYAEHTEQRATEKILDELEAGAVVALTGDAGTPGISDPGYRAVRAAAGAGFPVTVIPGPSAVITAFSAAAPGGTEYTFLGFLPKKPGRRRRVLEAASKAGRAAVFFESPNRLKTTLEEVAEIFGENCHACICREMTKAHEEFRRGTVAEIIEAPTVGVMKGEITVVVGISDKSR